MQRSSQRRWNARLLRFALVAAALAQAGLARAHNEVSVRLSTTRVLDASYGGFSKSAGLLQAELGYARSLVELGRGALWVEGSWTVGASRTELFGGEAKVDALFHSVTVGARYAVPIWPWLVPHLRVGAGALFGAARLQPAASGVGGSLTVTEADTDRTAGFAGYALAGISALVPRRWMRQGGSGFTAGIVIEGGMSLASALRFEARPKTDPELLAIPRVASPLGGVSLSGPVLRLGAVVRF